MASFLDGITNLLMDIPDIGERLGYWHRALSADECKRLAGAGAGASLVPLLWDRTEPARGQFDWSLPDAAIANCRAAGLRVVLVGPGSVPAWCPDEWYVWDTFGRPLKGVDPRNRVTVWGCLSPWNEEAQSYQDEFIARLCARYDAGDVLVVQSHSRDGESVLPPGAAAFYDPCALRSYRTFAGDADVRPDPALALTQDWLRHSLGELLVRQAKLYVESSPFREYWTFLHPYYNGRDWPNSGNVDIVGYMRRVEEVIHPDGMNALLYTVFDNGHDHFVFDHIRRLQDIGLGVWAGSEWPEGLRRNTPRAVSLGLAGLLTAPLHPYLRRTGIEPWVYDELRRSRAMLAKAQRAEVEVAA